MGQEEQDELEMVVGESYKLQGRIKRKKEKHTILLLNKNYWNFDIW